MEWKSQIALHTHFVQAHWALDIFHLPTIINSWYWVLGILQRALLEGISRII